MSDSLPRILIELRAEELKLCTSPLRSLAGKLNLEAGAGPAFLFKTEVSTEHEVVEAETKQGQPLAIAVVEIECAHVGPPVELGRVLVHLLLRVDVAHQLRIAPPLRRGLNKNLVGTELFDQFLRALSKHGRLVASADEVDILAVEALSEVHESCVKAVVTIKQIG